MAEPTVLTRLTQTLIQGAEAAGLNATAIVRELESEPIELDDPEGRVPFRVHAALWEAVVERLPAGPFGLGLAERFTQTSSYGVVGFLAETAPDIREGLMVAIKYLRLINERAVGTAENLDDGSLWVQFAPMPTSGAARHHVESMVAGFIVLARRFSGVPFQPIRVHLRHPAPPSTAAHDELFGCPVVFGAQENGILVSPEVAALPTLRADAALHTILRRRADTLINALPSRSDLLQEVEAIVKEQIAEGAPTVSFIARRLGLSSRTLQRRLSSEGVSYATLLDRFRRESALKLLDDERLAIHDVSMMLGFSEPKAFRRAFKRWTGMSPRAHRTMRRHSSGLAQQAA